MTVQEAIKNRSSVREYKSDPVPEDDLRLILEAGRLAPSGCNAQPWRFIIVQDTEIKKRLADDAMNLPVNAEMLKQAPVAIVCLTLTDAHEKIPQRVMELSEADPDFAEPSIAKRTGRLLKRRFDNMDNEARAGYMAINGAIAFTGMILQATELGYGTCWIKAMDHGLVRDILQAPDNMQVVAVTPLGRPDQTPPDRPRLPLDDLVFCDSYGTKMYEQ